MPDLLNGDVRHYVKALVSEWIIPDSTQTSKETDNWPSDPKGFKADVEPASQTDPSFPATEMPIE